MLDDLDPAVAEAIHRGSRRAAQCPAEVPGLRQAQVMRTDGPGLEDVVQAMAADAPGPAPVSGVDEDGQFRARPGVEDRGRLGGAVQHPHPGQAPGRHRTRHRRSHPVVTAVVVADADDDRIGERPTQYRSTVNVRKWVEQEMHGS